VGLLAPFANLRAIARNSTEKAFLRRVEPSVPRSPAGPARQSVERRNYRGGGGQPDGAWLVALAAIALIVGIVLPTGNAPQQVTPGHSAGPWRRPP